MSRMLLGLDVGTTATKAILFEPGGKQVAAASRPYPLLTPHEGWVEQRLDDLWQAVGESCRELASRAGTGHRIAALSLSSQAGTTIPVDAQGRPTRNAFSWMDGRAALQSQRAASTLGAERIYRTTGWPLHAGLPLQHLAWLREREPEAYARTDRVFFVNDAIAWLLTGERAMNPSDASITQLFDLASGDWGDELLDIAGIERRALSPVLPSGLRIGTLTAEASQHTGLPRETIVVNGAHDQYCAAVSTGVFDTGRTMLSCGTAWVLLAVPESLEAGLQSSMSVSRHAVQDRWGAIRSLGGVGKSVEWFLEQIGPAPVATAQPDDRFAALTEAVGRSPPGANGLMFLPLGGGHRSAIGPANGAYTGLSLSHRREDLARATLEGITLELRWALAEMQESGVSTDELVMVGGAAESPVWPQIVADVTDTPVLLPACRQAAAAGAAILAGVGAGIYCSIEEGWTAFRSPAAGCTPRPELSETYRRLFRRYQRMATALNP